ncbi:MAG: hypothetical protein ABUS51_06950 [Acidobacteriota bacterium]
MKWLYCFVLLAADAFLVWADTHTDELPIVLGFVVLSAAILGAAFPGHVPVTALVVGAAIFIAETLVHFSVLHAPYPPAAGLPWAALVAYVPAILGVGLGAGFRRLARC